MPYHTLDATSRTPDGERRGGMTNKELIENLLIEYDELDMQPMLIVPDPLDRAKAWKHELMYAIAHLEAEVAREIFEEIEKEISNLEYRANTPRKTVRVEELKAQVDWVLHEVVPKTIAELKKKYIGGKTDEDISD
jgi:hypothetical protein